MIASDSKGQLILTAWRALFKCRDADEAEAWACLEGLRLAAQWIKQPVIVESDCARRGKTSSTDVVAMESCQG